jgi:hypothetical protein
LSQSKKIFAVKEPGPRSNPRAWLFPASKREKQGLLWPIKEKIENCYKNFKKLFTFSDKSYIMRM